MTEDGVWRVPLKATDGTVIGTAWVEPSGKMTAKIDVADASLLGRYITDGLISAISIVPEFIPARPEPDTRPIYKKQRQDPFVNDTAEIFMNKARYLVRAYIEARLDKSDPPVEFQVYIVWFCKTLQNWKALVSSTLPDGMYYELTYSGDQAETYLDAYKKVENVKIVDTLEQMGFEIIEFDQPAEQKTVRRTDEILG